MPELPDDFELAAYGSPVLAKAQNLSERLAGVRITSAVWYEQRSEQHSVLGLQFDDGTVLSLTGFLDCGDDDEPPLDGWSTNFEFVFGESEEGPQYDRVAPRVACARMTGQNLVAMHAHGGDVDPIIVEFELGDGWKTSLHGNPVVQRYGGDGDPYRARLEVRVVQAGRMLAES